MTASVQASAARSRSENTGASLAGPAGVAQMLNAAADSRGSTGQRNMGNAKGVLWVDRRLLRLPLHLAPVIDGVERALSRPRHLPDRMVKPQRVDRVGAALKAGPQEETKTQGDGQGHGGHGPRSRQVGRVGRQEKPHGANCAPGPLSAGLPAGAPPGESCRSALLWLARAAAGVRWPWHRRSPLRARAHPSPC